MKKSTKMLSLILSVLMLLSVFSVANPVLAAEVNAKASESTENIDETTVSGNENTEPEEVEIISEIEEERSEYTKYFRMSDGSYVAAQYAQPVHYEVNGEWKEYDYSVTKDESTENFVIENTDNKMSFPEEFKADSGAQIEVSARDYEIKFSPVVEKKLFKKYKGEIKEYKKLKSNEITEEILNVAPSEDVADKNDEKLKIANQKGAIAYEEVYKSVDLEYEISSNQVKESIVLNSKQDKNKFEFIVDTDGLFPKKESDGSITLYEDKEFTKPVSSIMKPYMFDADGAYSYDVTMDIAEKNGVYTLTIKADNNWLNDKARKYPVVIDPTIVLDVGRAKTYDCYVDNSQASTSFPYDYYLYAGHSNLGKTRTFVKFDLPDLPDNCSIITNATIRFCQASADTSSTAGYLNLYNVTSDWSNKDYSVTWNNQPSVGTNPLVIDYAKIKSGSGVYYFFDITKTVKAWYEGAANYGLMLASANESVVNRPQLYSAENYTADIYPQILVTYRNNKGLEEHWSYSSYSNDTAGAAYINDYTGNLVYALPILSSVSGVMPLTLTAYFNNYCAGTKFCAGKDGTSKTTPGKGFRLNVQQTVLPSSEYGLEGTDATNTPYVYTDADGTEHYIAKVTEDGATVYKDEDGLGLTLITKTSGDYKYRLNDKSGNLWYFNDQGNLMGQKDANGNAIRIYFKSPQKNYDANQLIDRIVDGAGHTFTFSYYTDSAGLPNGYIRFITDNANRIVEFVTASGLLGTIKYPDGTSTKIAYEGDGSEGLINYVQGFDGYALNFDYTSKETGSQVKTVKEYGRENNTNIASQIVTFDRTKYNTTVIRSAGLDGIHYNTTAANGADDIVTTLQFDNEGKTISQQVSLGSGAEIGAGSYGYTLGSSTLGSANKLDSSSSLGKNTVNLLLNSNAESSANWTGGAVTAVTATHGVTDDDSYMGKKALAIKNTKLTGAGASYYYQEITGITTGTYTFSAYVRAGTLTKAYTTKNSGVHLQVNAYNSSNSKLDEFYSEKITAKTDTEINGGWRRLSVTVNIPQGTTKLKLFLCLRDVLGTVYFDCMQFESGNVANSYNMLENSSFEKASSNKPVSWSNAGDFTIATNSSGTVTDGSSTKEKKNGSRSLTVDGNALKSKGMSQSVTVKPNENDTYIISGWAKADAVNKTEHANAYFEIAVRVYYECKDSAGNVTTVYQHKDAAEFNTTISGWQYAAKSFALKYTNPTSGCTYTPTRILVMPRYCYQENTAYFDHIQLIKDEGQTQTYTYDEDGNVILTAVNSEQKVNTTYDDSNNLTSYTDTAGYKSTATYDDNHNLLTTKSARGVVTSNTPYSNGITKTSEIQNGSGTISIKTEQELDTNNNGAIVSAVYDQHGYKTSYTIHPQLGIVTAVKAPNDVVTNNKYNSNFTRKTGVETEGTSADYTFSGNRLSTIVFSGGSKSETYGYNYDKFGNVTSIAVNGTPLSTNTYGVNNGPLKMSVYGNNDKITYNYNTQGLVSSIVKTDSAPAVNATNEYSWTYTSAGIEKTHTDSVNNLKYLYDYDSLGRFIRQEIQTKDTSEHVGTTEFTYDVRNNLTKYAGEFAGYTAVDKYLYSSDSGNANAESYARDNLISRYYIANTTTRYVDYTYDGLNRLTQKSLHIGSVTVNSDYSYKTAVKRNEGRTDDKYKTTQLGREILDNTAYSYYYDVVGNITEIKTSDRSTVSSMSAYRSYAYDTKNQLTRENNKSTNKTYVFDYDALGNIIQKTEYDHTTGTLGTPTKTVEYDYDKDAATGWNNILTAVNLDGDLKSDGTPNFETNETITYDAIGNPITYLGASLTWNGRQLTSYTIEDDTTTTKNENLEVKYTYNANGLRGSKTVTEDSKTTAYNYYYVGGQLRYETRGNLKFYYFYDESGNLSAIRYYDEAGTAHAYFALTNTQGDVVSLYNNNGVHVASYEYDAWGNCTITKDTDGVAELNPIRYRGYYYDSETKLYYLQSRYYNPKVGRFLNADGYITTGQGVMSYNMFAYCGNNPVMYSDPTGCFWKAAKKWVADKWDKFTTWCSEKLSPQHDVPLYNQGNTNLCWAYSQTMVEDSLTGTTRTQLGADERARAIALEAQQETGSAEWNVAGFPRNTTPNTQIANPSMLDLTIALIDSPVYARYGNAMEGHYVVVTGVDIKKQTVFVNNPWGISGEQTYEDFLNGFVGMPDNGDFTLSFIWDAA